MICHVSYVILSHTRRVLCSRRKTIFNMFNILYKYNAETRTNRHVEGFCEIEVVLPNMAFSDIL